MTPWSSYLYSPTSPNSYYRPAYSPSSASQDYSPYPSLSSSPTSSRPPSSNSQISDNLHFNFSRPPSQSSDCRHQYKSGTSSCPTTPLSTRRGQYTEELNLTSPGTIRPMASSYRSSSWSLSPATHRKGVYDTLD